MTMTLVERLRAEARNLRFADKTTEPDRWVTMSHNSTRELVIDLEEAADALERLQAMPGREEIARAIEQAARQSVPWPDKPDIDFDEDDNMIETPRTLERFVNDTHVGEHGADRVFKAAADAAADAILALFTARV